MFLWVPYTAGRLMQHECWRSFTSISAMECSLDAKPVKNAIAWTNHKNSGAHHDAYMWCRHGQDEHAAALQLRHGKPKSDTDLKPQLLESKVAGAKAMPMPLFVVCLHGAKYNIDNHISIAASEMCNHGWLYLATKSSPQPTTIIDEK